MQQQSVIINFTDYWGAILDLTHTSKQEDQDSIGKRHLRLNNNYQRDPTPDYSRDLGS